MTLPHSFGGPWTEEKLNRLKKYLRAYMTIFRQNARASKLRTTYVDAFAGTGYRTLRTEDKGTTLSFLDDEDVKSFQKGSAQIALETEPSFNRYLFVEQN